MVKVQLYSLSCSENMTPMRFIFDDFQHTFVVGYGGNYNRLSYKLGQLLKLYHRKLSKC